MKSITELKALNAARTIFEKYRLPQEIYPQLSNTEEQHYVVYEDDVNEIIRELVELFADEHPLWNFGKWPHERSLDEDYGTSS